MGRSITVFGAIGQLIRELREQKEAQVCNCSACRKERTKR